MSSRYSDILFQLIHSLEKSEKRHFKLYIRRNSAKEGIKSEEGVIEHYKTICELVDGDVSAEVIATRFDEIIEEGKQLASIHPNIVVKVPMIKDGVKALKWFSDNGIKTNCTLVFSAGQAIPSARQGRLQMPTPRHRSDALLLILKQTLPAPS